MVVMLVLLRFTEIYRSSLAWRCMHAYVSDAAGSHSEIFRQLGHQIGRFLHVLHATFAGEKLRWLMSSPFEPNALIRKKHNLALSLALLEG
jgi:hypothetical protein